MCSCSPRSSPHDILRVSFAGTARFTLPKMDPPSTGLISHVLLLRLMLSSKASLLLRLGRLGVALSEGGTMGPGISLAQRAQRRNRRQGGFAVLNSGSDVNCERGIALPILKTICKSDSSPKVLENCTLFFIQVDSCLKSGVVNKRSNVPVFGNGETRQDRGAP